MIASSSAIVPKMTQPFEGQLLTAICPALISEVLA